MPSVQEALKLVPGLELDTVESSCCGMAGTFGYQAETYAVSQAMAERTLLPAVRRTPGEVLLVADGFSCRHQIHAERGAQ
jgi:Fe-S oxidoreductase